LDGGATFAVLGVCNSIGSLERTFWERRAFFCACNGALFLGIFPSINSVLVGAGCKLEDLRVAANAVGGLAGINEGDEAVDVEDVDEADNDPHDEAHEELEESP